MLDIPQHARGFVQNHSDIDIDRLIFKMRIFKREMPIVDGAPDDGNRATFPFAQSQETVQVFFADRQHVTLLGLAAPDLHGTHGRVFVVDRPQVKVATGGLDQLRTSIGKPPRANVMDTQDGILVVEADTGVDDFLAATLHLGVAPLHRVEIELSQVAAGPHGGRGAAAETDTHRGATQLNDAGARRNIMLLDVRALDVAHTTGNHDRFVVAAITLGRNQVERLEETAQLRSAELITKAGTTNRPLDHDIQGRGQPRGQFSDVPLPWHREPGYAQVGDHEGR